MEHIDFDPCMSIIYHNYEKVTMVGKHGIVCVSAGIESVSTEGVLRLYTIYTYCQLRHMCQGAARLASGGT